MAEKKCTKCGETKPLEQFYRFKYGRLGRQAECKPCLDSRRRANALANAERELASRREWAKRNPPTEEQRQRKALYRAGRKEVMRQYSAAWYAKNKDRLRAIRAAWHAANYETKRKPKMVQNEANRRARRRAAGGAHTIEQVMELMEKQRFVCVCCQTSIKDSFHRDHIVPLASGGSNDISNIQLLCPPCNRSKGARSMDQFLKTRNLMKEGEHAKRSNHSCGLVKHQR
jgi:5-methylcytosine-specific restriction endonuclease McrA